MWERLKARWRHYQLKLEEERLLYWRVTWKPDVWSDVLAYKHYVTTHRVVNNKPHVALVIMPRMYAVYYRANLTIAEGRLAAAMALMVLKRWGNRSSQQKPYVILTKDLRFPDGPEDNVKWVDWMRALDYLAPLDYVAHIAKRYPQKAESYIAQAFDLDPGGAKQRLLEYRMGRDHSLPSPLFDPVTSRTP